jgi:hypothetical protein
MSDSSGRTQVGLPNEETHWSGHVGPMANISSIVMGSLNRFIGEHQSHPRVDVGGGDERL